MIQAEMTFTRNLKELKVRDVESIVIKIWKHITSFHLRVALTHTDLPKQPVKSSCFNLHLEHRQQSLEFKCFYYCPNGLNWKGCITLSCFVSFKWCQSVHLNSIYICGSVFRHFTLLRNTFKAPLICFSENSFVSYTYYSSNHWHFVSSLLKHKDYPLVLVSLSAFTASLACSSILAHCLSPLLLVAGGKKDKTIQTLILYVCQLVYLQYIIGLL